MINHLIILSLLVFSFEEINLKATAKHTPENIINLTLRNANQKYAIIDTGNYLKGNLNNCLINLNNIYYRTNIRTFIYFVNDITYYDNSFLNQVALNIGARFGSDSKAENFIFILFTIDTRRYIFKLGNKINNIFKNDEFEMMIRTNSQYFEYSNYVDYLTLFINLYEKKIFQKIQNLKYTINQLFEYTQLYIDNKRNYFIGDPHKLLYNKLNFNIAQNYLEQLFLYKGIKTFIYLVNEIEYYSSGFAKELALKIGMNIVYDNEASNVFVLVLCIEKQKYFYNYGKNIQNYFNNGQVDNILYNESRNFKGGYYHDVIMSLLEKL
jgi:hypothetical protein